MAFQLIDARQITGQLQGDQIADGTITAQQIAANAGITGSQLSAEAAIAAAQLAAGIKVAGIVDATIVAAAEYIAAGAFGDFLAYSSNTPAAGNLIASISAAAGPDSFGNEVIQGLASYIDNQIANLFAGQLQIQQTQFAQREPGGMAMASWSSAFVSTALRSGQIGSEGASEIGLASGGFVDLDPAADIVRVFGALAVAVVNGGTLRPLMGAGLTPETWHNAGLQTPFENAGQGFGNVQYQYEPINGGRVRLRGLAQTTGTAAAGATIFTLPAGYIPEFDQEVPADLFNNGAQVGGAILDVFSGSGIVSCGNDLAGSAALDFDGIVFVLD